jgi:pyruvate-ferredoxin/flavodoxin oxidoreductase
MGLFGQNEKTYPFSGEHVLMDGSEAVIFVEVHGIDGIVCYPITPSTNMPELFTTYVSNGFLNISGNPITATQTEGEHAAGGGLGAEAVTGRRVSTYTSSQGLAYMFEQLFAIAGKQIPLIIHLACRPFTKSTLNVHAGDDDYVAAADTGFILMYAKNNQEVADFTIILRKISELALVPGILGQNGFLTSHLMRDMYLPKPEDLRKLLKHYLGLPSDIIATPTPAQVMLYGDTRRRIPQTMSIDNPCAIGAVTNQDAYMQSVAAKRPFFYDHVAAIAEQCMREYGDLTGRYYDRVAEYETEDAEYLLVAQGSIAEEAELVADYMRKEKGIKVGVANVTMFRPFGGDLISRILRGKKGVTVLERLDQPLAEDMPLMRDIRSSLGKAVENGKAALAKEPLPYPWYGVYKNFADMPTLYSASYGMGSRDTQPSHLISMVENMMPKGKKLPFYYSGIEFVYKTPKNPYEEIYNQTIRDKYPNIDDCALPPAEDVDLMPKDAVSVRLHSIGGWGMVATGKSQAITLFDLLGNHTNANPFYGSEKKGAKTLYFLSVSPEAIKLMCELKHVDVVMSMDSDVFNYSNPLFGLRKNGTFIIQSALQKPEEVWNIVPSFAQKFIKENNIRVFCLDGFKIASEEATKKSLTRRMQGIAFMGAFFATSPIAEKNNLAKEQILKAVHEGLKKKFGKKDEKVVEDNFRVVKRGFTEVREVIYK